MKIWKRILIRALRTWYLGAYIYTYMHINFGGDVFFRFFALVPCSLHLTYL